MQQRKLSIRCLIIQNASDLPFFENSHVNERVDVDDAMSALHDWIKKGKQDKIVASLPSYDFLAAFTRFLFYH